MEIEAGWEGGQKDRLPGSSLFPKQQLKSPVTL